MSDPNRDGPFECHGRMQPITLLELTGVASTLGVAAYVCKKPGCGIWRHGYPWSDSQLRAIVEKHMPAFIEQRLSA